MTTAGLDIAALRAAGCGKADAAGLRAVAAVVRPRKRWLASEFAEQRIRLTASMDAQIEGLYRCSHLPWLKAWHDLRRNHPGKKGVIAPKPAQTALTQGANNQILARLASETGNVIYLMGREEDAERIAGKRFGPQIAAIPELRARFAGYASSARMSDTKGDDGVQSGGFEFEYDGGTVYFRTGRTAASVATIPAGDVIIDEYDLLEKAFAGSKSGKLWEFALGRQAAIIGGDTWVMAFSHPTEWSRGIGKLFRDVSDQGTWVMDCPRCKAPVAPSLRDIHYRGKFAEGRNDPRTAWLSCPACGDEITEGERVAGVWAHGTRAGATGRLESPLPEGEARAREYLGFWIKGLMNPWKSIEHFARLLCGATDEASRQAAHNVHGGEPYEAVSETITPASLAGVFALRDRGVRHPPGGPMGVKIAAVGCDAQWPKENPTIYAAAGGATPSGDVYVTHLRLCRGFADWHDWLKSLAIELDTPADGAGGAVFHPNVATIDDGGTLSGQVKDACRQRIFTPVGSAWRLVPVRHSTRSADPTSNRGLNGDTPWLLRHESKRTDPARPGMGAIEMFDLHRHTWVQRVYDLAVSGRLHILAPLAEGEAGDPNRTPLTRALPTRGEVVGQLTCQVLTPLKAMHGWVEAEARMEWDLAKDRRDDWHQALAYMLAGLWIKCGMGRVHELAGTVTGETRRPMLPEGWGRARR